MDLSTSSESSEDTQRELYDSILDNDLELFGNSLRTREAQNPIQKTNFWSDVYPSLGVASYKQRYRMRWESMEKLILDLEINCHSNHKSNWEKGVVSTIDYMASKCRIKDLVMLYDISQGLVFNLVNHCITILGSVLLPNVCKWPSESELRANAAKFKEQYSLPLCVGAVDGTLINIYGMGDGKADLTSRKSSYALNLLLVCDYDGKIIYFVNGAPGSLADSSIYQSSQLESQISQKLENSVCSRDNFYILSDNGLPCDKHIVTPFIDDGKLSTQQLKFNFYIQRGRAIIERVNGMLKQRYQCINGVMRAGTLEKAERMILASIALHNYSILNNDLNLYAHRFNNLDANDDSFYNAFGYNFEDIDEYSDTRDKIYNFINDLD